jgi:hypothetical protein
MEQAAQTRETSRRVRQDSPRDERCEVTEVITEVALYLYAAENN